MPNYQITDPQSGKTVTVSGSKPPSQMDADEIFQKAGLRQPVKPQENILQKIGSYALPAFTQLSRTLGAGMAQNAPDTQAAEASVAQSDQLRQQIAQRAAQETDPAKKAFLLKSLQQTGVGQGQELAGGFQQASGLSNQQMQQSPAEFAARQAVGTGSELASFLIPAGKGATTALGRVGQAGVRGAAQGALTGLSSASREAQTLGQAAGQVTTGAALGAGLGATLAGAGEVVKGFTAPKIQKLSSEMDQIDRIIYGADNQETKQRTAASGFRKIYQAAFPFSKKGNAFERLKPEQTVDDMIRYGVSGTGDQIKTTASKISGKDGLLTNLVDLGIDNVDNPNGIKLPDIKAKDLGNQFTEIGQKEVNQQITRISNLKPGNLPGETRLKDMVKLERDLTKEGYEAITKGHTASNLKSIEIGELKLGLADKLRAQIDDYVGSSVVTKDPRIVQYLKSIGGDNLAQDYLNTRSVSDLRKLQTSFVRMSQIATLSDQLPSNLGTRYFNSLSKIPVIGSLFTALPIPLEQSVGTNVAVGGQKLFDFLKAGSTPVAEGITKVSQAGLKANPVIINPMVSALQRAINQENQAKQARPLLK